MLFFMTGIAIVLYLNQTPGQPRERDYAYAGSFYAYAIWVGMGVPALYYLLKKTKLSDLASAGLATVLALIVPLQMASQNWDDHDRSGRTIARDAGINYLESLEPNAILFCYGDNDTFPLWYIQDVERVRTDVRTVNLSYLSGDWYIDQMRRKTYTGEALPFNHLTPDFYYHHEVAYIGNENSETLPLDEALKQTVTKTGSEDPIFPTTSAELYADSSAIAKMLPAKLASQARSMMHLDFSGKRYLDRGSLAVLDVLAANKWKRPIYWTSTSPRDVFNNMEDYSLQTGMAYQLLPISFAKEPASDSTEVERLHNVNTEQMYRNVMTKFRFGGADNPKVYMDETARNMASGIRNNVFVPLANALMQEGDTVRAKEVLTKCLKVINPKVVPYDVYSLRLVEALYKIGMTREADDINKLVTNNAMNLIVWMLNLDNDKLQRLMKSGELYRAYQTASMGIKLAQENNRPILTQEEAKLNKYLTTLQAN